MFGLLIPKKVLMYSEKLMILCSLLLKNALDRRLVLAFFISFICFFSQPSIAGGRLNDDSYKEVSNILYRDSLTASPYMLERCRLDLYFPQEIKNFKTVIWFHGGGLTSGNKYIPDQLRNQGFAVAAVNYRLYPQIKAPAYIDDAAAAVAWVFKHISQYGGDASKIFVSGHSAGGYLTSMIGLDRSYLRKYDVEADSIAALFPFSGHAITHLTVRAERGIADTKVVVDELAPIFHIRNDAPPYIIITGDRELEMLGRYEENAYMFRMMQLIGHQNTVLYELDGFNHGEMANPAFYILRDYVRKH
jgi:acetyl esterase/lipase